MRAQVSRVADQKQMREAHGAGSGVSSTRTTIPEGLRRPGGVGRAPAALAGTCSHKPAYKAAALLEQP